MEYQNPDADYQIQIERMESESSNVHCGNQINTMSSMFASARSNVHCGNQIQIQIQKMDSLQVQGVMFIVETSKSCFSFSVEQGQRPQSLPLPTIVTMI